MTKKETYIWTPGEGWGANQAPIPRIFGKILKLKGRRKYTTH
jgi:hypothetical protein